MSDHQGQFSFGRMSPTEYRDECEQMRFDLGTAVPVKTRSGSIVIEKRYREGGSDWQRVDEEEFLRRTEWAGYWKKGTALATLRDAGQISTPWADFRVRG